MKITNITSSSADEPRCRPKRRILAPPLLSVDQVHIAQMARPQTSGQIDIEDAVEPRSAAIVPDASVRPSSRVLSSSTSRVVVKILVLSSATSSSLLVPVLVYFYYSSQFSLVPSSVVLPHLQFSPHAHARSFNCFRSSSGDTAAANRSTSYASNLVVPRQLYFYRPTPCPTSCTPRRRPATRWRSRPGQSRSRAFI
jgi:hypothetical protein